MKRLVIFIAILGMCGTLYGSLQVMNAPKYDETGIAWHLKYFRLQTGLWNWYNILDLNATRDDGVTFLMAAVSRDDTDIVRKLIMYGVDVEREDYHGNRALIIAARLGNLEIIEMLVEAGADINTRDHSGRTALHWVVINEYRGIVGFLIKNGARTDIKTLLGQDILELDYHGIFNNLDRVERGIYRGDPVESIIRRIQINEHEKTHKSLIRKYLATGLLVNNREFVIGLLRYFGNSEMILEALNPVCNDWSTGDYLNFWRWVDWALDQIYGESNWDWELERAFIKLAESNPEMYEAILREIGLLPKDCCLVPGLWGMNPQKYQLETCYPELHKGFFRLAIRERKLL